MKNIVVVFLNFNFLFFILFFPYYFFFIHIISFFFPIFFSSTHVPLLFSFLFFLFFPYHFLQTLEHSTKLSFFLFLFYLFSFFHSLFSLITSSTSFFPSIPSKHTNLKVTHNHTIWFSSNEDREREGVITKGGKSPPSSADLLCLHRRLSSSPSLLDLFTTANNMWLKWVRSIFFFSGSDFINLWERLYIWFHCVFCFVFVQNLFCCTL